jgi:hypothetical protein
MRATGNCDNGGRFLRKSNRTSNILLPTAAKSGGDSGESLLAVIYIYVTGIIMGNRPILEMGNSDKDEEDDKKQSMMMIQDTYENEYWKDGNEEDDERNEEYV